VSGGLPLGKRAPQRQSYRLIEMDRWRKFLGLPLTILPKFFPTSPDLAARFIIATVQDGAPAGLVRRLLGRRQQHVEHRVDGTSELLP